MKNKIYISIILFLLSLSGFLFWKSDFFRDKNIIDVAVKKDLIVNVEVKEDKEDVVDITREVEIPIKEVVDQKKEIGKVPFTVQAPLGDWDDMRFQDGCEEASIVMAMHWIQKKTLASPTAAQQEILKITDFEKKTLDNYIDNSLEDVGSVLTDLYAFKNFNIVKQPTLEDLKKELENGNIIIVPTYGRALKNPNYKAPGPVAHMLVLVGWDEKAREFVTNDPGTKHGEGYRYDENVLFEAIWAYPSEKKHPQPPRMTSQKAMLIIRPF
jgi:hypothetical protein